MSRNMQQDVVYRTRVDHASDPAQPTGPFLINQGHNGHLCDC